MRLGTAMTRTVETQPRRFYDGGVLAIGDRIGLPPDPGADPRIVLERHLDDDLETFSLERRIAYRRPAPRRDPGARVAGLPHRPDLDAGAVHLAGAQDRRAPPGGAGARRAGGGRRRSVLHLDRGPRHQPGRGRPGVPRRDGRHRHRRGPALDRLGGRHRRDDLRQGRAALVAAAQLAAPHRRGRLDRGDRLPRLLRDRRPLRPRLAAGRAAAVDGGAGLVAGGHRRAVGGDRDPAGAEPAVGSLPAWPA